MNTAQDALKAIQDRLHMILKEFDTRLVAAAFVGCGASAYAALIRAEIETPQKVSEIFSEAGKMALEDGALPSETRQ